MGNTTRGIKLTLVAIFNLFISQLLGVSWGYESVSFQGADKIFFILLMMFLWFISLVSIGSMMYEEGQEDGMKRR